MNNMINKDICPYCNHKFITTELNGEFTRIKILSSIADGNDNGYKIAVLLKNSYSLIWRYIKELHKKGFLNYKYGKSTGGRPALNLFLTDKSKKLLEDLK